MNEARPSSHLMQVNSHKESQLDLPWETRHSGGMASDGPAGRVNQKQRTRAAIIAAARDLITGSTEVTMPAVARAALVSEATAYRYFPEPGLAAAGGGRWHLAEPGRGTRVRRAQHRSRGADRGGHRAPAAPRAGVPGRRPGDDRRHGGAPRIGPPQARSPRRHHRSRARSPGEHPGPAGPGGIPPAEAGTRHRGQRRGAVYPDGPVRTLTRRGDRQRRACRQDDHRGRDDREPTGLTRDLRVRGR